MRQCLIGLSVFMLPPNARARQAIAPPVSSNQSPLALAWRSGGAGRDARALTFIASILREGVS